MLMWIPNLDDAASEAGSGPVGPGGVRTLMLVGIGRIVALWLGLGELLRALQQRG